MKNIATLTLLLTLLTLNLEAQSLKSFIAIQETNEAVTAKDINHTVAPKPFYQGEVVNVEHGGSYTYIEVKEKTNLSFWIATNSVDVKAGDFVRFQKELVMKDFKSKALNKVFKELMFASNLQYRIKK